MNEYMTNMFIDSVQNAKKTFVDTWFKTDELSKPLNEFVDAQTTFTKQVVKNVNEFGNAYGKAAASMLKSQKGNIMAFKLSNRSKGKLEGVHPDMVAVVERAIELTKIDFGVTFGVRTLEEQTKLYEAGRSQTMKSKHLKQEDTGYSHAVDLMAYVDGSGCWELNVYDDIADAMKEAAIEHGVSIKWGAAWSEGDIRTYEGSAEDSMNNYIDLRRSEGRRPFIDAPHFELM